MLQSGTLIEYLYNINIKVPIKPSKPTVMSQIHSYIIQYTTIHGFIITIT